MRTRFKKGVLHEKEELWIFDEQVYGSQYLYRLLRCAAHGDSAILDQFEETAKTTRIPEWDIKYAALYFTFDEQVYRISPSRFNQCDAAFELLVNDLIDALWNVGAYDMFYSGMMN